MEDFEITFNNIDDLHELPTIKYYPLKINGEQSIINKNGKIVSLTIKSKVFKATNKRGRFGLKKKQLVTEALYNRYF